MATARKRSRKDAAIASSLAIAVSLVSGAMIAHAQSFNVTGYGVPAGSATVFAGSGTTDIQVLSQDAVINWTPSDTATGGGPIIFQGVGTTATFTGNTGFTVLNRIVPTDPTRPIEFDGTVLSQAGFVSGPPVTGGTVFFYSPGGIILGRTAAFDVGNLGLTTSDVTYTATGSFGGANGTVVFQKAAQPGAAVKVASGAQVSALNAGSYVAMVAPSVTNNGTITVNGSAALVAAEGATINFSPDGLFNIQVDVGSTAGANALINTGTITGAAGTGLTQSHRIYFVAVPKNTAIGMVISQGSQLGFAVAGAADTDGNAVILSAGGDIAGGNALKTSAAGNTQPASVLISNTAGTIGFTSTVKANGTTFNLSNSGTTSFAANLDATGADSASLLSAGSGSIKIAGNLSLVTDSSTTNLAAPDDGGIASLQAQNGGTVTVTGNALVSASASHDKNGDGAITGGSAQVGSAGAGASVSIGGVLTVDASAQDRGANGPAGLAATGGNATIYGIGGGSVGVSGQASINADAAAVSSRASTGGQALAYVQDGGSFSLSNLTASANAASNLAVVASAPGGLATGGIASVSAQGTASTVNISGGTNLSATAMGGAGSCVACTSDGGLATGGTVSVKISAAAHTVTIGAIGLDASAFGGSGSGGDGGAASGGTARLINAGGTVTITDGLSAFADAYGGQGTGGALTTGGAASGGTAAIATSNSGTTTFDTGVIAYALGVGGSQLAGGVGGTGQGGSISVTTYNSGSMAFAGAVSLYGAGTGGSSTAAGGTGAAGTGGNVRLAGDGGTLTVNGDAFADASGGGGLGDQSTGAGSGGAGSGGTALIGSDGEYGSNTAFTAGSLDVTGAATALASGSGGSGGTGGAGLGGSATVLARFGQATLGGTLVSAVGYGGAGIAGGTGGSGTGGHATVAAYNSLSGSSTLTTGALSVAVDGFGGAGGAGFAVGQAGGAGGAGSGGDASVVGSAGNGTLNAAGVAESANGTGGAGGAGYAGTGSGGDGGLGGDGTGGSLQAGSQSGIATPANTGSASYASIQMLAQGIGGIGGAAGTGTSTTGIGGNGGTGDGGGTTLLVSGSPVTVTGNVVMNADGTGGAAGTGAPATITGGATVSKAGGPTMVAGAKLIVTSRFLQPSQRGSLTVGGSITGTAIATDGAGFQSALTALGSDPVGVIITNSDVNVTGGLDLYGSANQVIAGATPATVDISGSTANFGTGFAFNTIGDLTLNLDSSNLVADSIDMGATNWILGPVPTVAGTLVAGSGLRLYTTQDLVTYANLQTSFDTALSAPGTILLGNVSTNNHVLNVQSAGSSITLGNVAVSDLTVQAPLDVLLGTISATGFVGISSGTGLALGAVTAGRYVDLASGGAVTVSGDIQAGANVSVDAVGMVTLGNVSAGIVNPSTTAGDTFSIGIGSQTSSVTAGTLTALQDVGVSAPLTIDVGAATGADMQFLGGTGTSLGPITANGRVLIADYSMRALGLIAEAYNKEPAFAATPVAMNGPIVINGATVTAGFFHAATQSNFTSGDITAGGDILLAVTGSLTSGLLSSGGTIGVNAGAVSSGNLFAGTTLAVNTAGALSAGNVQGTNGVTLYAGGPISTGSVSSPAGAVTIAGSQAVTTGAISAGTGVTANAGAALTTGAIAAAGTPVLLSSVDTMSIAGPVSASDLLASSQGDMAGGPVSATASITVNAGGTITVGGLWTSPLIDLVSNDLVIAGQNAVTGVAGGLNAGTAGQINLESTNPAGMFIGDGLNPGSGYAISNAEWGRINSGSLSVLADDLGTAATTMTIGDLTITGPFSGSTIDAPNGSVQFSTGYDGLTSGTIRVVGNLHATGFRTTNTLAFATSAFELDAATGSVKIDDAAGNLSGILQVSADYIHIAEASILDRLRANPLYAGRFTDLNSPAAVQRPGGVFNALAFDLHPGQTLYIQNTGSSIVPAGFVTGYNVSGVIPPAAKSAGGISLIINGVFVTSSGPVFGTRAYDMLVNDPQANFTGLAPDSTLNGCVLSTGVCSTSVHVPPPPDQLQILAADPLGNEPFKPQDGGSSQEQQDEASANGPMFRSSIAPPEPLIDSRPLRPPANITEPVTGSGNPALLGNGDRPEQGGGQ